MTFGWLKRTCASTFILGIAALAQSPASSPSWNGWYYQTPAGWQAQATPAGLVFSPESASGMNQMRLLAAEPVQGTLSEWFENATRREAAHFSNFHLNAVQQGTTMHGKPKIYVTGQGVTPQGQKLVISYMGLFSLDGQGLLMETEFDTMGALRYLGAYGQFVKSIEPGTALKPGQERTEKRTSPGRGTNGSAPNGHHRRENDQTNKPGNPPAAGPPTAGEPLAAPKGR